MLPCIGHFLCNPYSPQSTYFLWKLLCVCSNSISNDEWFIFVYVSKTITCLIDSIVCKLKLSSNLNKKYNIIWLLGKYKLLSEIKVIGIINY